MPEEKRVYPGVPAIDASHTEAAGPAPPMEHGPLDLDSVEKEEIPAAGKRIPSMPLETQSDSFDRRTQPRPPAGGQLELRPEWFASTTSIPGQMLDINSGGFRVRHGFQALVPGHIVAFAYGHQRGRARVVWTRILGDQVVESGFMTLPRT
jgi:hypothetical protein